MANSQLPNELLILIIELCCRSSKAACIATCLVCSWARAIAIPVLYETVVLNTAAQSELLLESPTHCLKRIQNLICLYDAHSFGIGASKQARILNLSDVIKHASTLRHLTVTAVFFDDLLETGSAMPSSVTVIADHSPLGQSRFDTIRQGVHSELHAVTHLAVETSWLDLNTNNLSLMFPNLTHLAWITPKSRVPGVTINDRAEVLMLRMTSDSGIIPFCDVIQFLVLHRLCRKFTPF